jgi:phosphatidylglycerol:prolipoprotein diacylglycerol transferase
VIELTFDPNIAQIGPLLLGWHGLFTALAVAGGVWLGLREAARRGLGGDAVANLATWAVLGGLVGARLFHVLDHLPTYLADPLAVFAVWEGGIAVYGAFIGGITAGWVYARQAHLPAWPLLDAAAPGMLLGQAIGRIGCLSNGDAWGAPTDLPWGVVYRHPSALLPPELLGVPTHPYPLYEIIAVLALLGLYFGLARRPAPAGTLFLRAAFGYAVTRFALTGFRQEAVLLWGLQEAQLIALATGILAIILLLLRRDAAPFPEPSVVSSR